MLEWLRAAGRVLSWMTVLPTGIHGAVERPAAGRTITCLPLAGAVVGGLAGLLGWVLIEMGASPLLAGALATMATALLTRGMHLDGLADTVDALASYAPPERAREIMRSGPVGPLGAAAMALVCLVEATAFAQLLGAGAWFVLPAVGIVSRACAVWLCRRGVPAAPGGGFGPLVSGTQGPAALGSVSVVAVAAAVAAGYGAAGATGAYWAAGSTAALVLGAAAFGRHAVRRLGGNSGDVLGATIAATAMLAVAAFAIPIS